MMGRNDEGLATLAVQAAHQAQCVVGRLAGEVARPLVGPDDGGLVDEGTGDGQALPLLANKSWILIQIHRL